MACTRREKTGWCTHHQCEYADETGYECVEIVEGECEVGKNCLEKCEFSFKDHWGTVRRLAE